MQELCAAAALFFGRRRPADEEQTITDLICDVAVIGAGTAGLAAERSARAAGATTLLIDDRFAGTTCALVGCMPSKLLIAAAASAYGVARAGVFGVVVPQHHVDCPAVLRRVRAERDAFVTATRKSISTLPDEVRVQARATFESATTLRLDDGRRVTAKAVVIATGSRPLVPETYAPLGDLVFTNETVFELADLPKTLAVIGAGPLGLELAQAMARLGVAVTLLDKGETLCALKDATVEASLRGVIERDMAVHVGVEVTAARDGDSAVLRWLGASAGEGRFDRVLVATGRPPNLDGLGLETTGLGLDEHGVPEFDRGTMQCGTAPIFLAGDADADAPVLHEASDEGAIAGANAASWPKVTREERCVPFAITFTDPPVAVIGATADDDSVIGCASFEDQGRAKIEARAEGVVRLYAARPDGRLTGAAMVGPGMDHLGHLIAWAVQRGETATRLLEMPFYHPTLEEGLKTALREICGTVHAPLPANRDQGNPPGG
jgi:dihydrolipoamide dehydrogenase